MDMNEAYENVKPLITVTKSTLGLRTADDMEKQAIDSTGGADMAYLWAAGAYAIESNKQKFCEMITRSSKSYSAYISKKYPGNVSSMYQDQADAVKFMAENLDAAYDIVIRNIPEGSSKLRLNEAARMLFGKSIIENMIPVRGGIESVIEGTKNAKVVEDKRYMIRLNAGPLIFQAYDMESQEGKTGFENGIKMTKRVSGRPNLPTLLADGILEQPGNKIGWYLTKI